MKNIILIIDDEEAIRASLNTILKGDYTVHLAADARGGLNLLSENEDIGLIFLDLMLPDLNGLEVLRIIKDKHPSIPVVIITAHSTEEVCINAFRSGARDYIVKPFNVEEVIQKAKTLTSIVASPARRPIPLSFTNNIHNHYQDIPDRIIKGIFHVKDYIDKNYAASLNIANASKMAGINRAYFCKYFKAITKLTFKDYLINARLKIARELLKNKKLKINDVAEQIGYSPKYFSETFKKSYGISPKRFMSR